MKAATVYYDVQDLGRSIRFYTEVIGLALKFRFGDRWAEVDAGPISIGLHPTENGEPVAQGGGGTVSFTVDPGIALEDLTATLRERGADVSQIRARPRGRFVMITDPDGNQLHVIQFSSQWKQENEYD